VGAVMELPVVRELIEQRLADASRESLPARALLYLKFFSKNKALQKAIATLIQARIPSENVPGDLKRALSRALAETK
jgi:hypothetical protein